jgi:hypothetical protein
MWEFDDCAAEHEREHRTLDVTARVVDHNEVKSKNNR